MQLGQIYSSIKNDLKGAGIEDCDSEARIILREVAGIDAGSLYAFPEKELDKDTIDRIGRVVKRRLMREPLQYILGSWDFMGLNFYVEPGVLIPRADTEILTECALKELHDGMEILDLCTGTGCIAISLLKYSNGCSAAAVDISEKALKLTYRNAVRLLENKDISISGIALPDGPADGSEQKEKETDGRLRIIRSDLYDNVTDTFDIIVSNPPYINTAVIESLEPEVKDHEPHLALDGGEDGLKLIKRIINGAKDHLTGGGSLMLEIGYDQGLKVSELMNNAGFREVEVVKDYAGLDRVVKGIKPIIY